MGDYRNGKAAALGDTVFVAGKVRRVETDDVLVVPSSGGEHATRVEDGDTIKVDALLALAEAFNGAVLETIDIDVTESGGVVSLELQQSGGGDLTFLFNSQAIVLDCTPAETVALTAGTDTVPTLNYVYVTESGGTLTLAKSTTGFPSTSHAPIATVLVQSAASLATDGAYKVHAWTDHLSKASENGHLSHLNRKIRALHADWIDGCSPADLAVSSPNAHLSVTAGNVFQLHPHAMPAWNMADADPVFIVNDPTTAFKRAISLTGITQDANGNAFSTNKFGCFVLWGVVSEDAGDCQYYLNLPTAFYNVESAAIADIDSTAVYTIPAHFKGTGFLVARYTIKKTASDYSQSAKDELLGLVPSSAVGGAGGFDSSAFLKVDGTNASTGQQDFGAGIKTDDIDESSAAAGVTIDGVELKDGEVDGVDMLTGLWRIVKKDRVAVTRTNSTSWRNGRGRRNPRTAPRELREHEWRQQVTDLQDLARVHGPVPRHRFDRECDRQARSLLRLRGLERE
jgi:hypothetical protein